MAVINLIPPEVKRDIKAARLNVTLVQYAVALLLLALLVTAVYGVEFWLVYTDKRTIEHRIESQTERTQEFEKVKKEADAFRNNLKVAKAILSGGRTYSDFLITLGQQMPAGTVITSIAFDDTSTSTETVLQARSSSYNKALALKTALENSKLFENVSIDNVVRPPDLSTLGGISALYPYEVTLRASLSPEGS